MFLWTAFLSYTVETLKRITADHIALIFHLLSVRREAWPTHLCLPYLMDLIIFLTSCCHISCCRAWFVSFYIRTMQVSMQWLCCHLVLFHGLGVRLFFSKRSPVVSEAKDVVKSSLVALLGGADYILPFNLLLNAFTAKIRHAIYRGGYHPYPLYISLVKIKILLKSFFPSATTLWNRLHKRIFSRTLQS